MAAGSGRSAGAICACGVAVGYHGLLGAEMAAVAGTVVVAAIHCASGDVIGKGEEERCDGRTLGQICFAHRGSPSRLLHTV